MRRAPSFAPRSGGGLMPRVIGLLLLAALSLSALVALADPTKPAAPRKVKDFRLTDPRDGKAVTLKGDHKAAVVVFLGTQCPINNDYVPVLAGLHKEYAGKGVRFLAVNSN